MAVDPVTPADLDPSGNGGVPASERAFYVEEFAGATLVVSLGAGLGPEAADGLARAAAALEGGGSHLVVVASGEAVAVAADRLDGAPVLEVGAVGPGALDATALGELWLAVLDHRRVVLRATDVPVPVAAAEIAVSLRAMKLVLTDPDGGWGRPPRSFADVVTHLDAFRDQLAPRQDGAVVEALTRALGGGVTNVNLCRAEDVDRELFTFDGAGTLFTSGGYVELGRLRVDDLAAVQRLVAQGTADGLLRPRAREEVARLAAGGLGARVVGSGHLAGVVGLEVEPYRDAGMGEVSCLYTVSRFSGAGAGALLLDGLVDLARDLGLRAVFAVTVSDAAAAFFARRGFREVAPDDLPAAKWEGYDAERRTHARCFVRDADDAAAQGTLGF